MSYIAIPNRLFEDKGECTWIEHSECKKYIYKFVNIWDYELPLINFICLNPVKFKDYKEKDKNPKDIRTIENILEIIDDKKFGGLIITNLFSFCADSGESLYNERQHAFDDQNNEHLKQAAESSYMIVLAWGDERDDQDENSENEGRKDFIMKRARYVLGKLLPNRGLFRLTADGAEKYVLHPCSRKYRNKDKKLERFDLIEWEESLKKEKQ